MKIFTGKISTGAADLALLILRLVAGGSLLTHGIPKLIRLLTVRPIQFSDPLGLGVVPSFILVVFTEVVCSALVILGFLTRFAALTNVINFSVIFFIVLRTTAYQAKELPLLFLVIFFAIMITGAGRYSLDRRYLK